ncbi:ATP-binding protein, partial [Massilia sp. YIM B02787]
RLPDAFTHFNEVHSHSALGYKSPRMFKKDNRQVKHVSFLHALKLYMVLLAFRNGRDNVARLGYPTHLALHRIKAYDIALTVNILSAAQQPNYSCPRKCATKLTTETLIASVQDELESRSRYNAWLHSYGRRNFVKTAFLGKRMMAQEIAAYDWSRHPLGRIDEWPAALRTALGMILDSDFPMFLVWTGQFYAFYNDAYLPLLGSKKLDALGRRFADVWAEAWDVVGPIAEKAYAGESTYFEDLPIVVDRYGYPEQTYFSFSYSPVRGEDGQVAGVLCTVFETTSKVTTLARLKESEARFQLSLEASGNIGTWTVDAETFATTVDARFAHLFRSDAVDAERGILSLSAFTDNIHPDDRQRVLQSIAHAMESGSPYEEEYRLSPVDEALIWVSAKGRMFADLDTGKRRFAGVAVDITQRKQIETDLRRLAEGLAESNRRQQEFLAVLAHELRNPLAPIRTGLELIASTGDNPATVARIRKVMSRQVDHLVHLVDDLLDLARITSGKIVPKLSHVPLQDIVSQAIETALPAIEAKEHKFIVHVPKEPIWLDVDANRIAQVIANVLTNAVKYTTPRGEIVLMGRVENDNAVVTVTDNGIGIASDELPHVFDMFSQVVHNGEYSQGGLGIGLALAKQLTEMHGGTIWAESAGQNNGSTFTIKLPVINGTASPGNVEGSLGLHQPGGTRPRRILLADDNADAVNMLAQMLKLDGHEVRTASDGQQALMIAQEWIPDVALLDLGMPKMNGFELAEAMRASSLKDVELVAVTGWGNHEDRLRTTQAGFSKHITKPLDFSELRDYLASVGRRLD